MFRSTSFLILLVSSFMIGCGSNGATASDTAAEAAQIEIPSERKASFGELMKKVQLLEIDLEEKMAASKQLIESSSDLPPDQKAVLDGGMEKMTAVDAQLGEMLKELNMMFGSDGNGPMAEQMTAEKLENMQKTYEDLKEVVGVLGGRMKR